MSASPASARWPERGPLWIRGVNWLGDSVMSLPAVAAFKRARPEVPLVMACRPALVPFWALCPAVDRVMPLPPGWRGDLAAARELRRLGAGSAVVFPNSFRSAWPAFLAGVPDRAGFAGHFRRFLLTRIVHPLCYPGPHHQALDYHALLGLPVPAAPPSPAGLMRLPAETVQAMRDRVRAAAAGLAAFPPEGPWVAVAPGAARGPSKRWPEAHFAAAAGAVVRASGAGVVVCGGPGEREAGARLAAALPGAAVNLAGATTLAELAVVLGLCRAVLCNDSGPMHLAAAAGVPVAAVFGLTDPARTGPLGPGHRVLAPEGVRGDSRIPRASAAAAAALASIPPGAAAGAVLAILAEKT